MGSAGAFRRINCLKRAELFAVYQLRSNYRLIFTSLSANEVGKAVIIRSIEHLLNILYATSGLLSIVTILYPRARFMLVLCSFGFASPIVAWGFEFYSAQYLSSISTRSIAKTK
ncbi:hypothetical protein Tsp_08586 [Trichinella spiralis]|uniref:hypothetical protein n=1 Tax=Trichinella spiralis TaxID=6334 RepID=UPI0001EFD92A|nr:hypothetical protein Tsp_08586 [Trichinella spiralis]